jgi:hypothetical protein
MARFYSFLTVKLPHSGKVTCGGDPNICYFVPTEWSAEESERGLEIPKESQRQGVMFVNYNVRFFRNSE